MKRISLAVLIMALFDNKVYGAVPAGGIASFSDPHAANPTVSFNVPGVWTLQACVNDGEKTTCSQTTVTVNQAAVALGKLTVANANVVAGSSFDASVMLTTQTKSVAALQFDVRIPPGMTFNSAVVGASALAAGKSISTNVIGSDVRVIVFGLNQSGIMSGPVAILNFQTSPTLPAGPTTLSLANVVASDPAGTAVAMGASVNGTVTVVAGTVNQAPVVTISPTQTITLPAGAVVSVTVTDDGPQSALVHTWSAI